MTYDEILSCGGMPDWSVAYLSEGEYVYTFSPNKDGSKRVHVDFPEYPEMFFRNVRFLNEHNLVTVGDLINWLNKLGYNSSIVSWLKYVGVRFDADAWEWSCTSASLKENIIKKSTSGNPHSFGGIELGKNLTFHAYVIKDGSVTTTYKFKWCLSSSAPDWMCIKNHYKFRPEVFEFKKLPNEATPTYLGLEFEVMSNVPISTLQAIVTEVEPRQEPFFYFKHDGTINPEIGDDQYEIVTLPCSPRFLRKNLKLLFDKLDKLGLRGEIQTDDTCGLHVHMSSDSFYGSDFHIKKFITVFNQYDKTNKSFIESLGRRAFTHYCKNNSNMEGLTLARRLRRGVFSNGGNGTGDDKYSACRQTTSTVEVRIFKGEFSLDHIKYCMEVVLAMQEYCDKLPLRLISSPLFKSTFTEWLKGSRYHTLKKEVF